MRRCKEALRTESSTPAGGLIELRRRALDGRISGNSDIWPATESHYLPLPQYRGETIEQTGRGRYGEVIGCNSSARRLGGRVELGQGDPAPCRQRSLSHRRAASPDITRRRCRDG